MKTILLRGIAPVLLVLLAVCGWVGTYVVTPAPGRGEVTTLIPRGSSVRQIKVILGRQGLIRDDVRFLILARITGTAGRLKAGEYSLPLGRTPLQILRLLERGRVIQHRITVPEGMTLQQIADILEKDHWIKRERFLELTRDSAFIKTLGLNESSLEGYLFPDTYTLIRGKTSERTIIAMMVHRFQDVWQEMTQNQKTALSRHQIVTLASMVEKESGNSMERPLIARVFLNRLERGMRLQSDPTVMYTIQDFNGHLTRADLKRKTPYNTYMIPALPPGPICNPGGEAIKAVLHPGDSPALYFVSQNNGTHYFSTTLQEHNRAVHRYRKQSSQKTPSDHLVPRQ